METLANISTWVGFAVGCLGLALGLTTLARRKVAVPWLRRSTQWKRYGTGVSLIGVGFVLQASMSLADLESALGLVVTLGAVVPLVAGAVLLMRSDLPASDPNVAR